MDVGVGNQCMLVPHTAPSVAHAIPTQGLFSHKSFPDLAVGDVVSIADGELNLLITDITESGLECTALTAFFLTSGRSLSIRNKPFTFSANSEKDLQLVTRLQHANVRFLVSFTQSARDLQQLKAINPAIETIPKIENIIGDDALAGLLPYCKWVMLGRGDLSLAAHANQQFLFQKRLIDICHAHKRQLIVATGILAGIGDRGLPTIADVMDYGYLSNMGVDAFLITGTNALHKPFETLQFMRAFGLG
jgi:pyruvate kinase